DQAGPRVARRAGAVAHRARAAPGRVAPRGAARARAGLAAVVLRRRRGGADARRRAAPVPPHGLRNAGAMRRGRTARWHWTPLREAAAVALVLLVRPPLAPEPRPVVGAMNDDGVYVALGKAIAEGRGYRSTYLPGEPVQVRYPPALPAVLAVLWL